MLLTASLVTLIGLLILGPETRFARSLYSLVMGLTIVLALSTAGVHRRLGQVASIAAGALTLLAVAALEGGLPGASFGDLAVMAALVFAVPTAVLFGLRGERTVNLQTVFGAIAVYLDIGLMFALLISIDVRVSSAAYFAQQPDSSMSERVYFSFVTLATLGYGDLTPAGGMGRLFSVAESLLGSLYLVTAVSLVVSRVGSTRQLRR